jgi:hypothetical protein
LTKEAPDHYDPKKMKVEAEALWENAWLPRNLNLGLLHKERA